MKKIIMLCLLLAIPLVSRGTGLPVTDIPRVIMEFITNQVLMEADKKVQREKLLKLLETLREVKQIRARNTEGLAMEDEIERELHSIQAVQQLTLHDVARIVEKVLAVTGELYARDIPYLEEYQLLTKRIPGLENTNAVYDHLLGGTSAYADWQGAGVESYQDNAQLLQEQALKRYGLEVDASQRMIHTALTYQQLSGDLYEQAVDLSNQINREGSWNLKGIGDIFSNLTEGDEASGNLITDLITDGLGNSIQDWSKEIRNSIFNKIKDLLDGDDGDKEEQVQDMVNKKLDDFDFGGLLGSVLNMAGDLLPLPVPEYEAQIEAEGMRLTTGERIEVQGITVDNLVQSVELQLKADELMLEATRRTPHQEQVDATYQHALLRNSLSKIVIE